MEVKPYSISLLDTWRLIRLDYSARLKFYGRRPGLGILVGFLLTPPFVTQVLHRVTHFCYFNRLKVLARLLYFLNVALTAAEIAPNTRIGGGFILLHSVGMTISGIIGDNVVFTAMVGTGGNGSKEDIGAGPGLPIIGNNVMIAGRSSVLGPFRVGDGAVVLSHTLVTKDVPAGATVFGCPGRVIKAASAPERQEIEERLKNAAPSQAAAVSQTVVPAA